MKGRNPTSQVMLAALVLGLTMSPFAVAKAGDALKAGKENSYNGQTTLKAKNSGTSYKDYGTRFTNTDNGGGAILSSHGTGPAMRATNKESGSAALALSVESKKGPAAEFKTGESSAAPFTVNNKNVVTNLHAENSDQLSGQSSGRYAAAGVRVGSDGSVSASPASFGVSGVSRTAEGTYTFSLDSASNGYLIQLTAATTQRDCTVSSVSDASGAVTVDCRNIIGGALADSSFYVSATKP